MRRRATSASLQVGHVERYNPVVAAARELATKPQFFEIHRLAAFSPRSLDIDVVLDLMIHDIDIVLSLVPAPVREVRAVGIPVLSQKGRYRKRSCRVRGWMRRQLHGQPRQFRKDPEAAFFSAARLHFRGLCEPDRDHGFVAHGAGHRTQSSEPPHQEPLKLELEAFVECVTNRENARCYAAKTACGHLELAHAH